MPTTPAKISTVLFDLGGVVCRFHPERRLAALAADCGLSPAEIRGRVWESGFDRQCDLGRYSATEVYERVRTMLGLHMDYPAFRNTWASAFEPDAAVLTIIDAVGVRFQAALLTDNGPVLLEAMPLVFPEIVQRLDPLLFSCGLGAVKPGFAVFEAALGRLGEPAARVLLVDDTPRVIEGARAYGLQAVPYTTPATLRHDLRSVLRDVFTDP